MAQGIGAFVDALYSACQSVYASTTSADGVKALVCMGPPGQYQPNYIVSVSTAIRQPIGRPTMGTNRSREAVAEVDVVISCYVPGGEESTQTAIDAALSLQGLLETYTRTNAGTNMSGTCYDCVVVNADMNVNVAYQPFDDPSIPPAPSGRVADNTLTLRAKIRY